MILEKYIQIITHGAQTLQSTVYNTEEPEYIVRTLKKTTGLAIEEPLCSLDEYFKLKHKL